jgi:predicted Zn-dependent protease
VAFEKDIGMTLERNSYHHVTGAKLRWPRWTVTVVCLLAIGFPRPATGMTVQEEEDLSHEFMKVVGQYYKIIKDPVIAGYVNDVGQKLLSYFPPQPFKYNFYVIENEVYNAFAGPAGQIFVNSGLFAAMDSEEELAGILSHEIAHAVCRHVSKNIERSKKISMATLAGLVAGIFLGAGGSAAAANAVTVGTMAASQSLSLSYSRADEVQADQIGLLYLTDAGYDGSGLLLMLKKMRNKQWFDSKQIPTYLSTHPGTEDRIVYIDTWLSSRPPKAESAPTETSSRNLLRFEKAHARILALYGDEQTMLRQFADAVALNPEDPQAHYGYGLILARAERHKDALAQFKLALEKNALDPDLLKEIGRVYFLDGRYDEALSALKGTVSLAPDDPDGLFYLARTQMELGRPEEAVGSLEALLKKHRDYTQAYYTLGENYGQLGRMGLAHYNLGLYYFNKGDRRNAVFHLTRALKEIQDPLKVQEIEEILSKIKATPDQDQTPKP